VPQVLPLVDYQWEMDKKSARRVVFGRAVGLHRRHLAVSLLLVLAGVSVSALAARASAHAAAQRSRQAFRLDASEVDGAMDLQVQRETDLLAAAGAFMKANPSATTQAFERWAANVGLLKRFPELVSLSEIEPSSAALGGCPFVTTVGLRWSARLQAVSATDMCINSGTLEAQARSGRVANFGFSLSSKVRIYGESIPVYRTPAVPASVAARHRMLLGWVAITVYPQALMRRALFGFGQLRLEIRTTAADRLEFSSGPDVSGQRLRADLGNGTSEVIAAAVQSASILGDDTALLILLGGSCLAVLVGMVLFLLGSGRERAVRIATQKTSELAHLALHDGLTGLPNRTLVLDRINHALTRSARGGSSVAVLYVDLDDFKAINDSFGHGAGDEVLRVTAERLLGVLRDCDTVGRLGGDEFVVLLEPDDTAPVPDLVAQRILETVGQRIELETGAQAWVSASVGIAVARKGDADELLRNADLALYAAKSAGKGRHFVFEDELQSAAVERRALELDLRSAIANHELFLLYQPTFYLDDGRLRGVEALLRWQHPQRGVVSPTVFIPIAEESELIVEIGRWVTTEACRQAAQWLAGGLDLVMSLNVSARQLDDPGFKADVNRILLETGVDPGILIFELTETSLMREPEKAAALLTDLKTLGVRISIDDFGTGYSSLAYLGLLPVDAIKIDRSFVAATGASAEAAVLLNALVQLGRSLQITTLAEGIEDEAQLEILRQARCDLGQGFLLARPMPAEQLNQLVSRGEIMTSGRKRALSDPRYRGARGRDTEAAGVFGLESTLSDARG
jgi:diguanylate cyclase (GGDEF)-like protein